MPVFLVSAPYAAPARAATSLTASSSGEAGGALPVVDGGSAALAVRPIAPRTLTRAGDSDDTARQGLAVHLAA
ncbi:MAG: hypothetical protein ACK4Z0_01190 [Sphingomonadaceae bacterium]